MQRHLLLFDKFLTNDLSVAEREELKVWVQESEANANAFKQYIRKFDIETSVEGDPEKAHQLFLKQIGEKGGKRKTRMQFYKYAAVFIVLLGIGWATQQAVQKDKFLSPNPKNVQQQPFIKKQEQITITLADGTKTTLTPDIKGQVRDEQGNVVASAANGYLTFDSADTEIAKMNEVYIPLGQTFKIKLSDGTLVWLNAGSRLRFPQHFASNSDERLVFLEGEAYFDVTSNPDRPFIVNTEDLNVKVLGTQFNVSAYATDDAVKTTLVEGAVHVYQTSTPAYTVNLSPSYQASYNKTNQHFEKIEVDTDIYTSWMQNRLIIDHLSFEEILKKLERIHNVTIVNNARHLTNEMYKGEFQNESIETVLNTIAISTPFNYEIKDNIVTIRK